MQDGRSPRLQYIITNISVKFMVTGLTGCCLTSQKLWTWHVSQAAGVQKIKFCCCGSNFSSKARDLWLATVRVNESQRHSPSSLQFLLSYIENMERGIKASSSLQPVGCLQRKMLAYGFMVSFLFRIFP